MALNIKPRTAQRVDSEPVQTPTPIHRSTSLSRPSNGSKPATFVRSASTTNRRLIMTIEGEEKSGKSHTALTAPEPIYYHSFDIGLEGVISKFDKEKEIYVAEYELTIQPGEGSAAEVADAADKVWDQFVSNYRDSIVSTKKGGTIVWDSSTECWELLRLGRFGRLTQIMPHQYTSVNAEMRDLIRESYEGSNMIHLVKLTDAYENYVDSQGREKGRKTGEKEPKQFKDLPFLVQTITRVQREGSSDFSLTIRDCRQNPTANDLVLPNDFESLLTVIFE